MRLTREAAQLKTRNMLVSEANSSQALLDILFRQLQQAAEKCQRMYWCVEEVPTYVSGSTFILGMKSLNFISFFPILRQFFTASTRFFSLYPAIVPLSIEAWETNNTAVLGTRVCHG